MSKGKKATTSKRNVRKSEAECAEVCESARDNQQVAVGGRVYVVVSFLPEEFAKLRTLAEEAICSEAAMVRRLVDQAARERLVYLDCVMNRNPNAQPRVEVDRG